MIKKYKAKKGFCIGSELNVKLDKDGITLTKSGNYILKKNACLLKSLLAFYDLSPSIKDEYLCVDIKENGDYRIKGNLINELPAFDTLKPIPCEKITTKLTMVKNVNFSMYNNSVVSIYNGDTQYICIKKSDYKNGLCIYSQMRSFFGSSLSKLITTSFQCYLQSTNPQNEIMSLFSFFKKRTQKKLNYFVGEDGNLYIVPENDICDFCKEETFAGEKVATDIELCKKCNSNKSDISNLIKLIKAQNIKIDSLLNDKNNLINSQANDIKRLKNCNSRAINVLDTLGKSLKNIAK